MKLRIFAMLAVVLTTLMLSVPVAAQTPDDDDGEDIQIRIQPEMLDGLDFSAVPRNAGRNSGLFDTKGLGAGGNQVLTAPNRDSSVRVIVTDSGENGTAFQLNWTDADTCDSTYSLIFSNIDLDTAQLPSGATTDSAGRVIVGDIPNTAGGVLLTFSTVQADEDERQIIFKVQCVADYDVGYVRLPIFPDNFRPAPGTYTSVPGVLDLYIDGERQTTFDPYKSSDRYIYIWNVGKADVATVSLNLKEGYDAVMYGSTKNVVDFNEYGKFAWWSVNEEYYVMDSNQREEGFQLAFYDNDPNGTDVILLNVSNGGYPTGHSYIFFVVREADVHGFRNLDYPEGGHFSVATYDIRQPDRDYNWELIDLSSRRHALYDLPLEDIGDDRSAFNITKDDDGNGVVRFNTPPDFEEPRDSDNDNVYNIGVLGWELNPFLGSWYGNYYGLVDVVVAVSDVVE